MHEHSGPGDRSEERPESRTAGPPGSTREVRMPDASLGPPRFSFSMTPPLEHDVAVVRFDGEEALSELYSFDVEVAGAHADFVLDDRLERPATLSIQHGPYGRSLHGIVARIRHASGSLDTVRTVFTVVPELYLLTQHRRFRIYQDLTTPEIVDQVFATAGVYARRVRWRLTNPGAYPRRIYSVQYGETDFEFVSRLLEEEGIFFFFDHPLEGREVIVFSDSNQLEPIGEPAEVGYREDTGQLYDDEHVAKLGVVAEARSGGSALRDYDPLQPRLNLESTRAASVAQDREIYDYPGGYTRRTEGRRRAQNRLEASRARAVLGYGEGLVTRFQPGHTFALAGHPRIDFDQTYVLWRVRHQGRAEELIAHEGHAREGRARPEPRYRCEFECTPVTAPVRIPVRTPRPRVSGSETAFVVGPAGEEIYVDEYGRIKVQFHWDRDGHQDEHSTCWVRVAQSWAGAGWGGLVIPRIGMEVVVDFLSGDPDRPLVTGCVYNAADMPPNTLPAEKTKSTFKTNSSPGGNGFNELTFEDLAGSEKIFIHAQKDFEERVLHDHSTTVDHDQTNHVLHDQTEHVDVDQSMTVGHDRAKTVGADETIRIGANQSTAIGANHTQSVGGNEMLTVAGNQSDTVVGNRLHTVNGNEVQTVHGNQAVTILGHRIRTMNAMEANSVSSGRVSSVGPFDVKLVKGASSLNVIGEHVLTALTGARFVVLGSSLAIKPTTVTMSAPKKLTLKVDGCVVEMEPGKMTLSSGKGASIVLEGADVKINGTNVTAAASENATLQGGKETTIVGTPVKVNC